MKSLSLLGGVFCFMAYGATTSSVKNPNLLNVSSALDLAMPISFDDSDSNRLNVRSVEFILYSPIDYLFEGVINIAGHNEEGETVATVGSPKLKDRFSFDLHEGYLYSSKLIPRSQIKIGKFFLGVGRLNTFHQHDWPFTTSPKVFRKFLSLGSTGHGHTTPITAEGMADMGVEYSLVVPTKQYVNVVAGITDGYCVGHCHGDGERPKYPLFYLHPSTFIELTSGGLLIGASYLRRHDADHDADIDLGIIDITYKKREGRVLKWLWQSELFYGKERDSSVEEDFGFYLYGQYSLSQNIFLGMRLDGLYGENKKFDYAVAPALTYQVSEFSTIRASYLYQVDSDLSPKNSSEIDLQFTYILGAHPVHEF
jgi:hypothetical protein